MMEVLLGFLEAAEEGGGTNDAKRGQAVFGLAPERLNATDVMAPPGEFFGAAMTPTMLSCLYSKAVLSATTIRTNAAFGGLRPMPFNDLQESGFRTIWQKRGGKMPIASLREDPHHESSMLVRIRGYREPLVERSSVYRLPHTRRKALLWHRLSP